MQLEFIALRRRVEIDMFTLINPVARAAPFDDPAWIGLRGWAFRIHDRKSARASYFRCSCSAQFRCEMYEGLRCEGVTSRRAVFELH
jgi:hypothetical protein